MFGDDTKYESCIRKFWLHPEFFLWETIFGDHWILQMFFSLPNFFRGSVVLGIIAFNISGQPCSTNKRPSQGVTIHTEETFCLYYSSLFAYL